MGRGPQAAGQRWARAGRP